MWHLGFLPKVRLVTPAVKLARLLGGLRVCVFYIYLGKNASSYGEFRLIEIEMDQLTFDGILKQRKIQKLHCDSVLQERGPCFRETLMILVIA